MRLSLALILIALTSLTLSAQEEGFGITRDNSLRKRAIAAQQAMKSQSSVGLPYIDDFSQDHFPGNPEGLTVLWDDMQADRRFGYADNPPSIGMMVFDGLDPFGQPYSPDNVSLSGSSDTLTSTAINLAGEQDVVMSFFYQPTGYGEAPEFTDSLKLQFYNPVSSNWQLVWSQTGGGPIEFNQVAIAIEGDYLNDDFQFRFSRYGNLSGRFDTWIMDYVYIDANRSVDELGILDIAFSKLESSFLSSNYTSVPWDHYRNNASPLTISSVEVEMRNNRSASSQVSETGYTVTRSGSQVADIVSPNSNTILALSNIDVPLAVQGAGGNFTYPTNVNDTGATFNIEFRLESTPDNNLDNNRMDFNQVFEDYYAYDDGTPETAFSIFNFSGSGLVSYQMAINETDTLRGLDMLFVFSGDLDGAQAEDQLFYITIWDDIGEGPNEIVYQDDLPRNVMFAEDGGYVRYSIQDTVILESGDYHFGWQQPDDVGLNVGVDRSFDRNSINSEGALRYDIGTGWLQTDLPGALMIRPVFPSLREELMVGLDDNTELEQLAIWPNPTADFITIDGYRDGSSIYSVYDLRGQALSTGLLPLSGRIDLSELPAGMYMLQLRNAEQVIGNSRIIKTD